MRTFIGLALILASTIGVFGQAAISMVREVPNIAALKALNTLSPQQSVNVKGYVTPGDGGGGLFELDPTSGIAPDGGIWIAPNAGAGRWRRKYAGRDFIARWWGPTKTNSTLQTAIDWVSANGYGKVICDGGTWLVKADDATRITVKSGVTLVTAEDSQIVCAPDPADDWVLIDAPAGTSDFGIGPATLVGWNLVAPGGDTNKTGVLVRVRGTSNGVVGGIKSSNWYSQYADIGSDNINIQMFDQDWQLGAMAFGAKGDGVTDDSRCLQSFERFCERYNQELFMRPTTNGYLFANVQITNGITVKVRGDKTLIKAFYSNPTEGVLPHPSAAFVVSANNCVFQSLKVTTVGAYPVTETNAPNTGFFIPINIHLGTNTLIENCEFDVESGKGIVSSGSFTTIQNCLFTRCGVTFGLGNAQDWLYYEATSPFKGQKYSPLSARVINNTFVGGSPFKHTMFFSAADDFVFSGNTMKDMNTFCPLLIYSGDEGTTDALGTNIYRFSGKVFNNTITGTNFGPNAAICLRLNTPTNYVDPTFIVTNMYSAVTIEKNHIFGTGDTPYSGIQLLAAQGTVVEGNYVQTTGTPVHLVGNCNNVIIRGNPRLEDTLQGIAGTSVFSEGFAAPPSFSDIIFEDNTVYSSASDEYAWRNIEPIHFRNLTLRNNKWFFNGTAGVGDAPRIIQCTKIEGFLNCVGNYFYITNGMSLRRVAYFEGTNADVTFDKNITFINENASVILRGPSAACRSFHASDNHVGSMEFNAVTDLILDGNHLTSASAYPYPLEINSTDRALIIGNFITNFFNGDSFCAVIAATNSVFENNTVVGESASVLVVSSLGEMEVGNNVIRNIGLGSNLVGVSPPGTKSHIVYKQPLNINAGDDIDWLLQARRNGSLNVWAMQTDGDQANYYTWPLTANKSNGHVFWVHEYGEPTNQFGYGFAMDGSGRFLVGNTVNATAALDAFIFAHSSNAVMRVMSTNETGTYDAGLTLHVNGHAADQKAGYISFNARDLSSSEQTFAKIVGSGNVAGFDKRGSLTLQTANAAGNVQDALSIDHQQFVTVSQRIVLGTGAQLIAGTGNPENTVSAPVGSVFFRTDATGGYYTKTNGVGNTGWAVGAGGGGGTGDVVGPASSIDNQLALFNGATGKLLKASIFEDTGSLLRPIANNTRDLGDATHQFRTGYFGTDLTLAGLLLHTITGSPEGVTTADTGSLVLRKDGGADSTAYVKILNDGGNTGYYPLLTQDAVVIVCSDETTAITTGTKRVKRIPFALTLLDVRAELVTAQASGTIFTIDIKEAGVTIFSTKLTVDNGATTSVGAVTPYVLSDSSLAANAAMTVNVDQIGNGTAKGLTVALIGHR